MYNYSIKTTYMDIEDDKRDTQYRKEYLSAFNIEQYEEKIVMEIISNLYKKYKNNKQIINLLNNENNNIYGFDEELTFILFFHLKNSITFIKLYVN